LPQIGRRRSNNAMCLYIKISSKKNNNATLKDRT